MKKSLFLIFLLAIGLSCDESYLDFAPETTVTVGNFYRTQADMEKAVTGIYQGMHPWTVGQYFYLSEVRSKNFWAVFADAQRDWYDISNFSRVANLGTVQNSWRNNYQMINRANEVLNRIDNVPFNDEALRERLKAEARFMRALAHFQMVKLFNRVPIIDRILGEGEIFEIDQSEPNQAYEWIASEMSAVMNQFPGQYNNANLGRVTEQAAKGLLARVYMSWAGWPVFETSKLNDAKPLLEEIIAMEGTYVTWAENFGDMFAYENDNMYHIFEIQHISGGIGAGTSLPNQLHPGGPDFQFGAAISYNRLTVSDDFVSIYDTLDYRDLRLDHTITYSTGGTPYFTKFTDNTVIVDNSSDYPVNFPLLRYADVLLMHAEIENELGGGPTPGAISKLNRIRNRAGLPEISPATQEEFRLALELERRREFAFEGRYWFDLKRTDRGVAVINEWFQATGQPIVMTQDDYVYAVPLTELDVSPGLYEQNPGY